MKDIELEASSTAVIEFEPDWGIERYGFGMEGFTGDSAYFGVRHKHQDGWQMAIGDPKTCSCGAVAPDTVVAWLEVCRWKR
jgi:hypothetical protein